MIGHCLQPYWRYLSSPVVFHSSMLHSSQTIFGSVIRKQFKLSQKREISRNRARVSVRASLLPVDPWSPNIDTQSIASQLFAFSLFPYLGFLYFITKSKSAPKLTLFGFYFLLAFVGVTIPAGIYAKVHYGTSLSNVDWLHGGAESLLTLSNLFVVLGLRQSLRNGQVGEASKSVFASRTEKDEL